jgi:hypothetical protein
MIARVVAVALLCVVPASLSAQSYARQVWTQLQTAYDAVSDGSSFSLNNYVIGKLADGATDTWTFPLQRGKEYLILGVCDNDCADVDIVVKGLNGNVVVKDEDVDDNPVTRFRVTTSGRFTVEIGMADCKDDPCFFGFGLFEK